MENLIKDHDVPDKDKEELDQLKAFLRQEKALPTDLLNYKHLFKKYAKFHHYDVKPLMNMAHFMGVIPCTGLNTINNILRLAKIQIPIDAPIVKFMTSHLVARELNMLFRQLRREDVNLDFEDLDALPEDLIDKICYKRGIDIN